MKEKYFRKTIAAGLALLITSGIVPVKPVSYVFDSTITASADTEEPTETAEPEVKESYYDEATHTLVLAGELKKKSASEIICLPDGVSQGMVQNITVDKSGAVFPEDSSYMFMKFTNLKTVDLTGADMSKVKRTFCMFFDSDSLDSVVVDFGISNTNNLKYMFAESNNLKKVVLKGELSNANNMARMFQNCWYLSSVDLSGFKAENIKDMSYMFDGCNNIGYLDLRGFNTGIVTTMAYMFNNCSRLVQLDLSSFDTGKVENMSYMFNSCSNLASIDVSSFDTGRVSDMSCMFNCCSSLTSLDLTSFDTSSVTNLYAMFNCCKNLVTIWASEKWSIRSVEKSSGMFNKCSNLKGWLGTAYREDWLTKGYAHIDGANGKPGYFSPKIDFIKVEAVPATYKSSGNIEYYIAYIDSNAKSSDNAKYYKKDSKKGTYTEISYEDTIIPQLVLVHFDAVPVSCEQDGNREYWYDEVNKKYFADADAKTQLSSKNVFTKATGHNYEAPVWSWSQVNGVYTATMKSVCKNCGDIITYDADVQSVTKDGIITYTATAVVNGVKYTDSQKVHESYSFTVEGGTITSGQKESYSYADAVTVKADSQRGKKYFSGWYIDDVLITTKQSYTFYVKGDTAVVAKYEGMSPIGEKVDVAIRISRENNADGTQLMVMNVNWALPSGCKLQKAGLVRRYDSTEDLDLEHVDGSIIRNKNSTLKTANGTFTYELILTAAKAKKTMNAVAFVTYKDKKGVVKTVYTDVCTSLPIK